MSVEFPVRLPNDLDAEVRKAAADAGLSLNAYIVRTLRQQSLRDALAAVGNEGALLVDTGHDDPAQDIRRCASRLGLPPYRPPTSPPPPPPGPAT